MPPAVHDERPLLILTALREEATPLRDLLIGGRPEPRLRPSIAWRGRIGDRPALLIVAGMGAAAGASTRRLLDEGPPPLGLLLAGVAGGLDPNLPAGATLLATEIRQGERCWRPNPTPPVAGLETGALLTTERILTTAAEKRAAAGAGARAVDLEAAGVAAAAAAAGVPWACMRAISDPAGQSLPVDFNRCRRVDGELSLPHVLGQALQKPGRIVGLLRLRGQMRLATASLTACLRDWLPRWLDQLEAAPWPNPEQPT